MGSDREQDEDVTKTKGTVDDANRGSRQGSIRLDWKDYLALTLALIQSILLPLVILIVILVAIVVALPFVR